MRTRFRARAFGAAGLAVLVAACSPRNAAPTQGEPPPAPSATESQGAPLPGRTESAPEPGPPPGWHESSLRVGGVDRWFRIFVPRALAKPAPVVLLLHGGSQSMRKVFREGAGGTREWPLLAEERGFLLVAPNGTNAETGNASGDRQAWNDLRADDLAALPRADDVGFLAALLDFVQREYPTDRSRVYVTGASNGGLMTYRLLVEIPERFAAGAAFVANLPASSPRLVEPKIPTPLMIANGTQDPLMPWAGGEIWGHRGRIRSAPETVRWWVDANRADGARAATRKLPDGDLLDLCRIHETNYPAKPGGAPVLFLAVRGGGHAMPSIAHDIPDNVLVGRLIGPVCRDAEGARLAWGFLEGFRRE